MALLARYVVLAAEDVANDDDTARCLLNAPCCDRIPACTVPGVQLEAVRSGGLVMAEVAACEFTAPGDAGIHCCVDRLPAAGWLTPARRCAVTGRWCRSAEGACTVR